MKIVIDKSLIVKLFAYKISWFGINIPIVSIFIKKDSIRLTNNVVNPTTILFFITKLRSIMKLKLDILKRYKVLILKCI